MYIWRKPMYSRLERVFHIDIDTCEQTRLPAAAGGRDPARGDGCWGRTRRQRFGFPADLLIGPASAPARKRVAA